MGRAATGRICVDRSKRRGRDTRASGPRAPPRARRLSRVRLHRFASTAAATRFARGEYAAPDVDSGNESVAQRAARSSSSFALTARLSHPLALPHRAPRSAPPRRSTSPSRAHSSEPRQSSSELGWHSPRTSWQLPQRSQKMPTQSVSDFAGAKHMIAIGMSSHSIPAQQTSRVTPQRRSPLQWREARQSFTVWATQAPWSSVQRPSAAHTVAARHDSPCVARHAPSTTAHVPVTLHTSEAAHDASVFTAHDAPSTARSHAP